MTNRYHLSPTSMAYIRFRMFMVRSDMKARREARDAALAAWGL